MFSTVQDVPKADAQFLAATMPAGAPIQGQMTFGNRQLAAVSFVILMILALVASLAYLAGRMVTPVITTATEPKPPAPAQKQLYVMDPAPTSLATILPTPSVAPQTVLPPQAPPLAAQSATQFATPSPATAPAVVAPVPVTPAPPARPTYWQVASVDRGMADVSVEYLKKHGLPAFAANGATPGLFRVLVGPARTPEEVSHLKTELTKLGFTPFAKRM